MNPGDVIANRFEILRSAGFGGMGAVYQARDLTTDKDVALKVLVEREGKLSDRFAHEVELLSTLDHPHIVGYVTHGATEKGTPFLVMPWLEGEDLQARLDRGPLSVDETLVLARSVAEALAYLHGRGLVHRDLKPSNIFLMGGKLSAVKVIDLGIAFGTLPSRPLTLSGVLLGTPGFMAPEQARGDHEVAPTADIFSLGCVLFECLTGERLFGGSHVMAVLAKVLVEDAPRVRDLCRDVPDALDFLVHRMVAKEPDRRPKDGAQLREWLDEAGRGPPLSARTSPSLTANEQRVVTVLVVILPVTGVTPLSNTDETKSEIDPFRASSGRFGVRVVSLDARTALALAPEGFSAADQAAVLARFGRFVVETFPGASVALATGSALAGSRLPVGEAIDRGVSIVRDASPGHGVRVDDVSAALLISLFDLRRDEGRVFLDDERRSLDPTRPLLGRPTSCVGRDREFAILEATFAECVDGAGPKVVLVTAAAGVGKSRLRHEFARRIRGPTGKPPKVLQCSGDPLHVSTPYAQIAHAVREAVGVHHREPPERLHEMIDVHVREFLPNGDVARVSAFLAELLGAPFDDEGHLPLRAARHSADAMTDQIRLAFEDIARAWCKKEPVLLVLEDLHWADATSVKLLDGALRKLEGAPLFVLALARPEVHGRFPGLWQNRHVTELRLPPLAPRASAKLVDAIMGERAAQEDVTRIVERSEGNAFYLEELIRAAAERGGRRSTAPPSRRPDDFPETIIAVAQARLERLEPAARKVLRAASIFGEVFSFAGVQALVGSEDADIERILAALIEQEAISTVDATRNGKRHDFVFRHVLLRGAAYATLTEGDCALGHRLAAKWLEECDEDREVVALHWLEAGDHAHAAACFERAGEIFWARAQADAAARCTLRSLLLSTTDATSHGTILSRVRLLAATLEATRRINAHDVMTGVERHVSPPIDAMSTGGAQLVRFALDGVIAGLKDVQPSSATRILAHAATSLGALSSFDGAKEILALARSHAGRDEALQRLVRYASARVACWAGELGAVVETLSDTLLPEEPRDRIEMLLILARSIVSVEGRSALSHGLDYVNRAEALLEAVGTDPVAETQCQKARSLCFARAADHARAMATARETVLLARRADLRYEECIQLHNVGEAYLHLSNGPDARAALLESNAIAHDIGADLVHLQNEALLAYLDGHSARLEQLVERFRAEKNSWRELHALYWLARLFASTHSPRARQELTRTLELARQHGVRTMADDCTTALAALAPSP